MSGLSSGPHENQRTSNLMELRLLGSEEEIWRVEVVGKMSRDGHVGGALDSMIAACGEGAYGKRVLLSLAKSPYVDSTGIEWLLNYHKKFKAEGGTLITHSASPATMQLFKLMRLDTVLLLETTEASALNRARSLTS